jgi:hypothetical protein
MAVLLVVVLTVLLVVHGDVVVLVMLLVVLTVLLVVHGDVLVCWWCRWRCCCC